MDIIFLLILFIILPIVIVFVLKYLFIKSSWNIGEKWNKALLKITFSAISLFIVAILLKQFNIQFRGINSFNKIFAITTWIIIITYVLLDKDKFPNFNLTVAIFCFFLAPFCVYQTVGGFFYNENLIEYQDEKYRIEDNHFIFGGPKYELYVNKGIFEYSYLLEREIPPHFDSIKIEEGNLKNEIIIYFYFEENSNFDPNPMIEIVKLN